MDEETRKALHAMRETLQNIHMQHTQNHNELSKGLAVLTSQFIALQEEIKKNLVPRPEFTPVKLIAFGLAGIAMTTVFTAMILSVMV